MNLECKKDVSEAGHLAKNKKISYCSKILNEKCHFGRKKSSFGDRLHKPHFYCIFF